MEDRFAQVLLEAGEAGWLEETIKGEALEMQGQFAALACCPLLPPEERACAARAVETLGWLLAISPIDLEDE